MQYFEMSGSYACEDPKTRNFNTLVRDRPLAPTYSDALFFPSATRVFHTHTHPGPVLEVSRRCAI